MNIIEKSIDDLIPYENNPRKNEKAVDYVAKSIQDFGFKVPLVIDDNNIIVCGHTRYLASKKIGLNKIPCIIAKDLNKEQIKAFRLVDNKVADHSKWDFEKLYDEIIELEKIDLTEYGFEELKEKADFFEKSQEERNQFDEDEEEYKEFIDKFKPKHTSDDCYTPEIVYNCIVDYVENEYGLKKENFVRPFKPEGDYENEIYNKNDVVVDNPPFSIESQIIDFYLKNNIKFFLFCNGLTAMNLLAKNRQITLIVTSSHIVYENGAQVRTAFVTNLDNDGTRIKTAPSLDKDLQIAFETLKDVKQITEYIYPKNVLKTTDFHHIANRDFKINENQLFYKHDLKNSDHCYGGCILVSDVVADAYINLKENNRKEKIEKEKTIQQVILSDEELQIIEDLNNKNI